MAEWNAKADTMQMQGRALIEEIKKVTNGMITFTDLGDTAIPPFEQFEAMRSGVIDISWSPGAYGAGIVPVGNAITLQRRTAPERRALGIEDLFNEIYEKYGIRYVSHLDASSYSENFRVFLNVMIDEPEDLKGLKMRTSASYVPMLKHFGATPVSMPGPDTYTAMERGTVDGFVFPATQPIYTYSMQEVTKYFVSPGFGAEQVCWFWNLDSWNTIPPEFQNAIDTAVVEVEKQWVDKMRESHLVWIDKFLADGMEEIKLSQEAGDRLVNAYYDTLWEDVISKDPVYAPKLRALMQQ